MKSTLTASLLLLSLLRPLGALAHGEDEVGPHGGFIRMPGAFHTEVVLAGKNSLKVYLLDIEWKNPVVKDSSVLVTYQGKTTVKALCEAKSQEYFECVFPKDVDLKKKALLKITAQRALQKGNEATYALPLKLESGH